MGGAPRTNAEHGRRDLADDLDTLVANARYHPVLTTRDRKHGIQGVQELPVRGPARPDRAEEGGVGVVKEGDEAGDALRPESRRWRWPGRLPDWGLALGWLSIFTAITLRSSIPESSTGRPLIGEVGSGRVVVVALALVVVLGAPVVRRWTRSGSRDGGFGRARAGRDEQQNQQGVDS